MSPAGDDALYSWRPVATEADVQAALEIVNAAHHADGLDERESFADLKANLLEPEPSWRIRTALWERQGRPVAVSALYAPEHLPPDRDSFHWWDVHPDARDPRLGDAIVAWADAATVETSVGAENVSSGAPDASVFRAETLLRNGFTPVRCFLRLRRDLTLPIPDSVMPAGYIARAVTGPEEAGAWVDACNASFIDHWSHVPHTPEQRLSDMARPDYRRDLDVVAVSEQGEIAAFCWGMVDEFPDGSREYWIAMLGTARGHRKRGLARALIAQVMRAMADEGATTVKLGVDAESPTGATRLYDQIGFTTNHRSTVYRRAIPGLVAS